MQIAEYIKDCEVIQDKSHCSYAIKKNTKYSIRLNSVYVCIGSIINLVK